MCGLHFEQCFIVRDYVHCINGTQVRIPRGTPTITPDSVPTILHKVAPHLGKRLPLERNVRKRRSEEDAVPCKRRLLSPTDEPGVLDESPTYESGVLNEPVMNDDALTTIAPLREMILPNKCLIYQELREANGACFASCLLNAATGEVKVEKAVFLRKDDAATADTQCRRHRRSHNCHNGHRGSEWLVASRRRRRGELRSRDRKLPRGKGDPLRLHSGWVAVAAALTSVVLALRSCLKRPPTTAVEVRRAGDRWPYQVPLLSPERTADEEADCLKAVFEKTSCLAPEAKERSDRSLGRRRGIASRLSSSGHHRRLGLTTVGTARLRVVLGTLAEAAPAARRLRLAAAMRLRSSHVTVPAPAAEPKRNTTSCLRSEWPCEAHG
ncbi:hypothetical protein HPB49_013446 [Dermacentor silvarum]|uniref:Uncharacterized protein n=1 Tax=Dermacentor silvarum TaxID=543639 RepID=A0ACB8E018_DERSI|nr:hypothetical protein HPB49_013446 [Dermacentor silvarum]